jgi:hypothetical protein
LQEKVGKLEAASIVMTIEMGGKVFQDEETTNARIWHPVDDCANRFAIDTSSLFVLADPKHDKMRKGLQKTAAVVKAQLLSIDMDTINLSYGMRYPSSVLKTSDKLEVQLNDGIVWIMAYSLHKIFHGKYNSGTHQHMKKAYAEMGRSVQVGISYYFPVRVRPQPNAVFSDLLHVSSQQAHNLLVAQTPLFNQIIGGHMSVKQGLSKDFGFYKVSI